MPRMEHIFEDGVEKKRCSNCKKYLPLDNFGSNSALWDGLSSRCQLCRNLHAKNEYDPTYHKKRYDNNKKCAETMYRYLTDKQKDAFTEIISNGYSLAHNRTINALVDKGLCKCVFGELELTTLGEKVRRSLYGDEEDIILFG